MTLTALVRKKVGRVSTKIKGYCNDCGTYVYNIDSYSALCPLCLDKQQAHLAVRYGSRYETDFDIDGTPLTARGRKMAAIRQAEVYAFIGKTAEDYKLVA